MRACVPCNFNLIRFQSSSVYQCLLLNTHARARTHTNTRRESHSVRARACQKYWLRGKSQTKITLAVNTCKEENLSSTTRGVTHGHSERARAHLKWKRYLFGETWEEPMRFWWWDDSLLLLWHATGMLMLEEQKLIGSKSSPFSSITDGKSASNSLRNASHFSSILSCKHMGEGGVTYWCSTVMTMALQTKRDLSCLLAF